MTMWPLSSFKGNVAAISEARQTLTYEQLERSAVDLASTIPARSLVLCLCQNELGCLVGYVAFLNHSIVPIMLAADPGEAVIQSFLERYRPDYIYLPIGQRETFGSFAEVASSFEYVLLKTPYEKEPALNEELALLLTTSGSTGSRKLVRLSYKNLRSNMLSIVTYLNIGSDERSMTTLPMNYTYGLSVINSHLQAGASLLFSTKTLMQKEFWQQLTEFKVTSIPGVPYTYEMLDRLRIFRMQLPSLMTLTQAGGRLSETLHEKFARWAQDNGKKFVVMYGQTEATARMSYLPSKRSLEKVGSIGIAIPGGKFELLADGELIYHGDNVALGYAENREDLAKADEFKGVLPTGDMARVDEDGFYYIVGRKKRFLKIFGNRVNLDEAEGLIKNEFPDIDCACGGVDDKMVVYVTDIGLKEKMKSRLAHLTGLHSTAFKFVLVQDILKNEAGKVLYKELEKLDV